MSRGSKGPRQPGGGRQQAGPRHKTRGTRGAARLSKGEDRFGKAGGRSGEGDKRFGKGEGRFGKREGRGDTRFGDAEGGKRFGAPGKRSGKGEGRFDRSEGRGGKRFGDAEGGKRFGARSGEGRSQRRDEGSPGGRAERRPYRRDDERFGETGKRFGKSEGRFGAGKRSSGRPSSEGRLRRPPRDEGEGQVRIVPPARSSERVEAAPPAMPTAVQTVTVTRDEDGMRVDRFFEARFPGLSFSHIQRIIRKAQVRVDGRRTEPKARLAAGQSVRIPPLTLAPPPPGADAPAAQKDRAFLKGITLYEDDDVMVLNKPMGLAVQGGSGTTRHVDGMLGALRGPHADAQRPRLVHRLDKDTAGCLLVAKTRFAAAALAKTFRSRSARKIYWALVAGVPKPRQGRISTYLTKEEIEEDSFMRVAEHGEKDAVHAVTYYAVIETSAQKLAWVSLKPVTGRTHQLRAHMAHVGHPIVGDPKYFNIQNWEMPGGIQNRLHLLARRIVVPHPRGGTIDVSAPLPPHMEQSWNLLGFDTARYDPIVDAPEE